MKSKILYLAVAAICCSYLPAGAQETGYDYSADGIYYRILADSENCVEVAYGDKNAPETIVIPSTVPINGKEYTVIGLGDISLCRCSESKYLVLPPTLRYIEYCACSGLELRHVEFPENLESIGNFAFDNCYLGIFS